jgi:hypothetical protein
MLHKRDTACDRLVHSHTYLLAAIALLLLFDRPNCHLQSKAASAESAVSVAASWQHQLVTKPTAATGSAD